MKSINKIELLQQLEQRLESQLKVVTAVYQNLSDEVLLRPSGNGGWSIAQCFDHLNTYGNFYLPAITKGLNGSAFSSRNSVFKSTWLGNYFTKLMEPNAQMKKMKAFKNHLPKNDLNPHAEIAMFITQTEQLLALIKLAYDKDINAIKIPISLTNLIRLKLGDVFQFILAHNDRHIAQAERNL
ncbi:MAG: DinB family protein [bacterium]|nr:DinB family protein [bacterium]